MLLISQKLIEDGKSGAGGWNRQQIILLGLTWPPHKGWRKDVIGNPISEEDAKRFVSLKDRSLKATRIPNLDSSPIKALEARVRILERQVDAIFVHLGKDAK